ncbi:MAG: hypothetical protein D6702_01965 [Planctomycetota bacterium]|nr:MAG: hypothetical protein D6702_01965 [Planctomycetota bacterium]
MRTLLNQFSEAFGTAVDPVLPVLHQSVQALREAGPDNPAQAVLPRVLELQDQLQTLCDKVAEQRAYLLIFGPLKSGKSTLMNALSAEYVSEVTALPAYPCLVNIRHAAEQEFSLTRYDGSVESVPSLERMREELHRAHAELAERLRQAERAGEDFDPAVHAPRAVRRVELRLPAAELERSGTVLVDTPGLYTRMKFGYDQMTRDFRDSAACAVFVVRTDNLFLEQVFAEFNDLLELFSRIFLVVNLDTSKQDLRPDGSLAPSLEQEDPQRILDAFESLAMSAPLKAALEEGRLRIFAVDLLQAASRRLRGEEEPEDDAFRRFRTELADYLNSSEYLAAFVGDCLRRAERLAGELAAVGSSEPVQELGGLAADLEREQAVANQKLETIRRLDGFSWAEAFRPLREELAQAVAEDGAEIRARTARALAGAVEAWYRTDASLGDLGDRDLAPLLGSCQNELALALHRELGRRVGAGEGGPRIPSGVRVALTAAGVELDRIARERYDALDPYAGIVPASVPLHPNEIPVRRGFWDWLFFRSRAKVAVRLFGPPEAPRKKVPKALKNRRLGPPGRAALQAQVADFFDSFFPRIQDELLEKVFQDYALPSIERIKSGLAGIERDCRERLRRAERRLAGIARVREALDRLEEALEDSRRRIREMTSLHGVEEAETAMGKELVTNDEARPEPA